MKEFFVDSLKLVFGIDDDKPLKTIHVVITVIIISAIGVAIYLRA